MQRVKRNAILKIFIIIRLLFSTFVYLLKMLKITYIDKKGIPECTELGRHWARHLFAKLGYKLHMEGEIPMNEAGLVVGNHISFLDIPLVWAHFNVTFVSKIEVGSWPIFGRAAKMTGTILLKRDSYKSRKNALEKMAEEIKSRKKMVAIFPEGTSSITGKSWKWGAFSLAEKNQLPVQVFCLNYQPLRETAYIDNDSLFGSLWRMLDHYPTKEARIIVGPKKLITDHRKDCLEMQAWCQGQFDKQQEK